MRVCVVTFGCVQARLGRAAVGRSVVVSSGACSGSWRLLGAWLVCAAQGYDQGSGADQEEGGDGGADADE